MDLRKGTGTDNKHIRNVPTLQIPVECTRLWIVSEDGSADLMHHAIWCADIEMRRQFRHEVSAWIDALDDLLLYIGNKSRQAVLVFSPVVGHSQERHAERVPVCGIEIEIVLTVGQMVGEQTEAE